MEDNDSTATEQDANLAFVGLDNTGTYEKHSEVLDFLLKGTKLIGTNSDHLFAQPSGFMAGNGSIVVMFKYVDGQVSPKIGKPHAPILEGALKYSQLNADEAVVLGNNLETDILLDVENYVSIIFMTSGAHQCKDMEKLQIHPTRIIDGLRELLAE